MNINYYKKYYKKNLIYKFKKKIYLNSIVSTIGRIIFIRNFGKISFADIIDYTGKIQILFKKNKNNIKLGDIIYVNGKIIKTKKNQLTINCLKFSIVNKNFYIYPDKFHKIKNKNINYKNLFIEYSTNNKKKNIFFYRSKIFFLLRKFLLSQKFIEVETSIINNIYGGEAKTFKTNYKNRILNLRVSPEIELKKILISGMENIFEIGKNFRNEGTSKIHSPEFSSLEFYSSYRNFKWLIKYTKKIITKIFLNNKKIIIYKNKKINFYKFKIYSIKKSIEKFSCLNKNKINNIFFLKKEIKKVLSKKKYNKYILKQNNKYVIRYFYFDKYIQNKIWNPTFIKDFPISLSILAKSKKKDKNIAQRFELFIANMEIANGYVEQNSYKEQKRRFLKQHVKYDTNFINALAYGMPYSVGCGIGLDRLIMLMLNLDDIKNVIPFSSF
ncbi:amino acid--tRNA ligase-related protein [Candidatus Vidania fulgoroideorum]